jgi:hypothetical protein
LIYEKAFALNAEGFFASLRVHTLEGVFSFYSPFHIQIG